MKRNITIVFMLLISLNLKAQTFNGGGGNIPDYNGTAPVLTYFPCVVSGLPANIDSVSFGLERVCLNIVHSYDQDLEIKLMSPDSFIVMISFRNGGNGQNYSSTCFRGQSTDGLVVNGNAPFIGEYDPDGDLFLFNNGRDPNGTWYLIITDFSQLDVGWLNSFFIVFGNSPSPHTAPPCNVIDGTSCRCPDGTQNCDLFPDMTASAAALLNGSYESNDTLYINNATPNIGWGPLEIHGIDTCFCDTVQVPCTTVACPGSGLPPTQLVVQSIYHKTNSFVSQWLHPAGTMSYHPSHFHTHLDGWAEYTLRRPVYGLNPVDWPVTGQGAKRSYCLINWGQCSANSNSNGYCVDTAGNLVGRHEIKNFGMGQITGCGVDQGIYVGNYDVYNQYLPDQWIVLDSLCNGDYYLVSITDPDNLILESDDNNNWAAVPFTLAQQLNLPFPSVNFTFSTASNTITFTNGSTDYDSLLWDFGDGATDTAVNPVHTYGSLAIFHVVLTAYNRCGLQQRVDTIDLSGIGIYEGAQDVTGFTIYPNPASTQIKIDFSMSKRSPVTLELFDSFGKLVKTLSSGSLNMGSHQYVINASEMNLARGVYSIHLTSAESNITRRVVFVK